jgi:uncharacterized damage-inducible protein DinB
MSSMDLTSLFKGAIGSILERDLEALRREVEAYPDEKELWRPIEGIANPGGTLVLHLAGNLQHFFGARLAGTGYVRDRAGEFSRRNVPRAELLREIDAARHSVHAAVRRLSLQQLTGEYPDTIGGVRVNTGEYLLHLLTHLAYHLGQVDYHRRVSTRSTTVVDAVQPTALSSAQPAASP